MKPQIRISGASRLSDSGPAGDHWQVEITAACGDEMAYRGGVGVSPINERADVRKPLVVTPTDTPDWLPAGILEEQVYWYVVQMLGPTLH